MATEQLNFCLGTELASVDLSAGQFLAAKIVAGGIALCGAGEACDGLIQNKPLAGVAVDLAVQGRSKCIAGAALAKGVFVTPNAAGKLVAAAAGNYILGRLAEASSADGDIVSVLMTRPGRLA